MIPARSTPPDMIPVSVIICTHNPRPDYLQRVLDALKAQTLPKENWELLLMMQIPSWPNPILSISANPFQDL